MNLEDQIKLLPIELQHFIYEYNPDHRYYTQKLHDEFFGLIYPSCRICYLPFEEDFIPVDYFILSKYKLNCHWCSVDCFHEDNDIKVKLKCLLAINSYVSISRT